MSQPMTAPQYDYWIGVADDGTWLHVEVDGSHASIRLERSLPERHGPIVNETLRKLREAIVSAGVGR